MPLTATLLAIFGNVATAGSALNDIRTYLSEQLDSEAILADLVDERFRELLPRLRHLCPDGEPNFRKDEFIQVLRWKTLPISRTDELVQALIPVLASCVYTPGASGSDEAFLSVYESILLASVQRMWKRVSAHPVLANALLIDQNKGIQEVQGIHGELLKASSGNIEDLAARVRDIAAALSEFQSFAEDTFQRIHGTLLDKAPPAEHTIDNRTHLNPFLLVRAEDFNHNYARLARLFQHAPEWSSIQSRTDNVFVEGGRGTGKSMILRRLTAQATVAATRLTSPQSTFENVSEDYFGVYVKLTRGYYDQFEQDGSAKEAAALLAQHEINIEVFDAFVDALLWLQRENALPNPLGHWSGVARALSGLFPRAQPVGTLEELRTEIVRFEQEQVLDYLRDITFGRSGEYLGSARDTVGFMRQLSTIFRSELFPRREVRLFLLFDEFETLTPLQQRALNTVMKMRLPDLTLKVGVRKAGRRTSDTFTEGDPIQSDYADPADTERLLERISADPEYSAELYNYRIAPLGTKGQVIGLYRYWRLNPRIPTLMYASPVRYRNDRPQFASARVLCLDRTHHWPSPAPVLTRQ